MSDGTIARGRRHVRLGVGMIALSSLGAIAYSIAAMLPHDVPRAGSVLAAVLAAALFCAELLRGNRAARAVAFVVTFLIFLPALFFLGDALTRTGDGETMALAALALLVGGGFALASLTDEATAWHRARQAERRARRERKARSLADWRAGDARDHGGTDG